MTLDITMRIHVQCVCGEIFQAESVKAERSIDLYHEWREIHAKCRRQPQTTVEPVTWLLSDEVRR